MGKFWMYLLLSIVAILTYSLVGVPDAAKAQSEPLPTPQTVTTTEPNPIVKPTDWAYISLKLVAAKFNCLSKTSLLATYFISDIEITRYKFGAVLGDCLSELNKLLPTYQKTQIIKKEDLAPIQKLQEEFEAELATVGKGLIAIETRTPIQPSDPLYKQLQLVMEEYGCIAGTRNRIYDIGKKELQPAELVEILKSCLQRVNQLAASGTIKWTRAELKPLAKLESEFYNELYRL